MGQNCLLLELEFLKFIWLEDFADFFDAVLVWQPTHSILIVERLTVHPDFPCTEHCGKRNGIWQPFLLDDEGSEDEETSWNIDALDILCSQRARRSGLRRHVCDVDAYERAATVEVGMSRLGAIVGVLDSFCEERHLSL
jgi:hypothetical protein